MCSVFHRILNADMDSSHVCLYAEAICTEGQRGNRFRLQNQSQVDADGASGTREMYLLELIESGTHRGTWASHITRTLIVWPCLMQWSIMIDIPAAVTSGPQYLIKNQPNIRRPQMSRAPEELALLLVMKDRRMEK